MTYQPSKVARSCSTPNMDSYYKKIKTNSKCNYKAASIIQNKYLKTKNFKTKKIIYINLIINYTN
jgi:hypothetical protein